MPAPGDAPPAVEPSVQPRLIRHRVVVVSLALLAASISALAVGQTGDLPVALVLSVLCVWMAAADLLDHAVPRPVLLAGTIGLVALEAVLALVEHRPQQLGTAIIGLGMALAVLAPAHVLSPDAIDQDELLFGLLCGAGLGWFGIWNVAFGLVLALALGALVAGPMTVARRRSSVAFPLVPVLAVSAYVAALWGQPFFQWYH